MAGSRTGFVKRSLPEQSTRRATSPGHGVSRHGFIRPGYPELRHVDDLYSRSLITGSRIPAQQLRNFSRTIPAKRAIRKIANNVIRMPWVIQPPVDKRENPDAQSKIKNLRAALTRPNYEEHNSYSKLVRAVISELLTLGFAAIERQPGDIEHPFWLWVANGETLNVNPDWKPGDLDIPRYFDCGHRADFTKECRPIFEENLFILQFDCNAHELVPPSPIETAYRMISAWLGLGEFQFNTTTNAVREYLLSVEDCSNDEELAAFRQYWETDVINQGKIPIVGGRVGVQKLGARNDEELYPKFNEMLIKMIAMCFDLSMRSFNIEPAHDNRATAGIAADTDFQDAILPMADNIRETLQLEVIDFYEPGYILEYTDIEPRSEEEEANVAAMLYSGNIATLNEMRIRVGLDPVGPGGDTLFNGISLNDLNKKPEVLEKEKQKKLEEQQKALAPITPDPNIPIPGKGDNLKDVRIPDKASKADLEKLIKAIALMTDETETLPPKPEAGERVVINASSIPSPTTDRRQPLDILLGIKRYLL